MTAERFFSVFFSDNQSFIASKSGPTWARTKDPLIMSQVL